MSDNKKYYYLKLKEDFFESDELIVLESMPDGYLYSNILLKLYLKSLKDNGRLMFRNRIPYSSEMLGALTRHSPGVVEKAVNLFKELGLLEVLDNGAIYLSDIELFVGQSSTEADRKREYRLKIENEKNGTNIPKVSDKNPPETREQSIENRDKSIETTTTSSSGIQEIVDFYEKSMGQISPYILDEIRNDLSEYNQELVLESLKLSALKGKRYDYARGILKNWASNNVKTLHDIEVLENNYKKSKEKDDRSGWTPAERRVGFKDV